MRLEKFLCCFDLELGGVIIGFYHLIVYCLSVLAAIISFVATLIYCELKIDLRFLIDTFLVFLLAEEYNLILLIVGLVVGILILLLLIYISWQLILGTEFVSSLELIFCVMNDN